MNQQDITLAIQSALGSLDERDTNLLSFGVNERSITHKLANYLQNLFPDYDVDCEYNRLGSEGVVKKIYQLGNHNPQSAPIDDVNAITVFPDIIIHKRGETDSEYNLLVIEAKKFGLNTDFDRMKLDSYKHELHYQFAALIVFPEHQKRFTDSLISFV